jgi:hypothetical protein
MNRLWLLLCLGPLLITVPANAGRVTLYALGGVARPIEPDEFRAAWKNSISFAGGFGYRTGPWLEIGAAISIDRFKANGDRPGYVLLPNEDLTDATVLGGETSLLYFNGEARIYLPLSLSRMSVWALGGAGLFRQTFQEMTISQGDGLVDEVFLFDGENALGVSGGGGVGFRISPELWATVEATYIVGFTSDERTSYLPLRVGLAYR